MPEYNTQMYLIITAISKYIQQYLDICGGKSENDTDLQTYPANFGYAQQFKAISKGRLIF